MSKNGLASILKSYDKHLVFADDEKERHHFPSGILALNHIIAANGGKGIPGGTIIQLLGEAKHGKSTLSLDFIAQAQKTGLKEIEIPDGNKKGRELRNINAAILDFEHSFDPTYARTIGVDLSKLLIITPDYAEDGFNIAEALIAEGLQLLVLDSVGMLVSNSEADKAYDDAEKIGSEAKALGRFLKRANALVDLADGLMIVINHYRANLSPMARSDKKPYGARILQYAVKATIKITRTGTTAGRGTTEVFIEKTKFGPEGLRATFDIVFGDGIDYSGHILTLAEKYGIVTKKGSWYEFQGIQAQGLINAASKLPIDEIRPLVIEALKGQVLENDNT